MFLAHLVNGLFDLLAAPCGDAGWAYLTLVSALAGVLLLVLFKVVTPQAKLVRARARLTGHLYELGLYQDDLGVMARIQKDLILANLRYVALTLPALVVLIPPAALILIQLEARLHHEPLAVGDTFLVSATLDPGAAAADLALEPGAGLALDSPPVRDRREGVVWWRVKVEDAGWTEVTVADTATGGRWTKEVKAAPGLRRFGLVRERGGLGVAIVHPAEDPLPADAAVEAIRLHPDPPEAEWYARAWFWWFCAVSVAAGLAVKGIFHVEV